MKYASIGFLCVLVLYGCGNSPRGTTAPYVGTPWAYGGDGNRDMDHGGFGFGGGRSGAGGAGRGGGMGGGRGAGGAVGGGSGRR